MTAAVKDNFDDLKSQKSNMSRASRQSRPKSNYGFGKTQPV